GVRRRRPPARRVARMTSEPSTSTVPAGDPASGGGAGAAADGVAGADATLDAGARDWQPGPRPGPRLRWWREVLYIVLVYVAYSAVRNQFGSGAGSSVDPDPAFHHAEAVIHIQRSIGLYFEHRLQSWYLELPLDGLIRFWNVYY